MKKCDLADCKRKAVYQVAVTQLTLRKKTSIVSCERHRPVQLDWTGIGPRSRWNQFRGALHIP